MFRGLHRLPKSIQEALARLVGGRTVSTIARRVGTLHPFDRIHILERERIGEKGASAGRPRRKAIRNLGRGHPLTTPEPA